ncbi:MAG: class I SAM-dependent methyltransferase [Actinobacteria bacterium]|nr:MAG: class I SAM-dependent methyltransferase [Actinomycetota bacterium]
MSEPATWGVRRTLLDLTDKLHLARPVVRAYELALAAKSSLRPNGAEAADGLPLPPARLRAQIGPLHAEAAFFLRSGESQADLVRDLLREDGTSIEELDAILDFGCGCGRVLRHWARLDGTHVHGCDIDARMIGWCAANLPFAEVAVNELSPPLPYGDASFDLLYALSVFTHLSEDLQHAWIDESRRVLRADGYLLISTLGEYYVSRKRLTESERAAFARGELVVLYERSAGTSLCSAYHPPEYVREQLARGLDLVAFRAAAAEGGQDVHLFRKPR